MVLKASRPVVAALSTALVTASTVPVPARAAAAAAVDLRPVVTGATFGAGSVVSLPDFQVANTGTATATGLHATLDLVTTAGTPELTFTTAQRGGCTTITASRATCPMPDAPAGGSSIAPYGGPIISAIEAQPRPGGADTPMTVRLAVHVTANEPELAAADNTAASQVARTVRSGATDYSASVRTAQGKAGELTSIDFTFTNHGPATIETGETVFTYVTPAGTEWARDMPAPCLPIRPKIEYRCTSTGYHPPQPGPHTYTFPLRMLQTNVGQGQYRVEGMGGDTNPTDNVAAITIDVEGAPPNSTPPTSPVTPPAGASGGSGLPVTGHQTMLTAGLGGAAVIIGAVLFILTRRRQIRLEPPTS